MLNLQSAQPYSFTIDGDAYVLNALTWNDLDEFNKLDAATESERINAIRDFIGARADKRTQSALGKLAFGDVMVLFKDWAGVQPGESSSSLES